MASADGQGHLLSLKVMRVSRPGLASAWEPFYSSSSSFSAHSTASILSLQGTTPLPGHPKTLRDLTHVSEFLTLPAAFGAIQLGETFSCCFSVNNETHAAVDGVSVRVEMQTASSKVTLAELGGTTHTLAAGDGLEHVVQHEVKELGQHVLACTVSYRLPPGFHHVPGPAEGSDDPSLQSFRKFYKFSVTNPLSVKTKVHAPKSPSALLHPLEREKVFLEVHIQNMTQETMWFDRMELECAEGFRAIDANHTIGGTDNTTTSSGAKQTQRHLFSGSMALMQPQAIRQYIYIISPTTIPTFPMIHPPGAVIPLGRLDISWRSKFGEPGRLLTSMLSRRIPGPPPPNPIPPSAIPPYLQRAPGTPSSPSRPRSPQLPPSRPSSPPAGIGIIRSSSPFRGRPQPPTQSQFQPQSQSQSQTILQIQRPQSPGMVIQPSTPRAQLQSLALALESSPTPISDLEVDLLVVRRPGEAEGEGEDEGKGNVLRLGTPFTIRLKVQVAASLPRGRRRLVSIVIQHLTQRRVSSRSAPDTTTLGTPATSRFSSYASATSHTVASHTSPQIQSHTHTQTQTQSQGMQTQGTQHVVTEHALVSSPQKLLNPITSPTPLQSLPPPYFETPDDARDAKLDGCSFLGSSALPLDPIDLVHAHDDGDHDDDDESQTGELTRTSRVEASREFELTYLPLRTGFVSVGGLRVILVGDTVSHSDVGTTTSTESGGTLGPREPRTVKEVDVIAEIWIQS